jgi:putative pyruvate formate lyase activating enzyme
MSELKNHKPLYLQMESGEREARVEQLRRALERCRYCPRRCGVDRAGGQTGLCGAPSEAVIDGAGPHFGEERVLVGKGGSGTIFFVYCNLACVFCQNWTISQGTDGGKTLSAVDLSAVLLDLQQQGCSNINLVSPTPYLYPIAAAIDRAAKEELHLPVVYNSSGYESVEMLKLLRGFVDIYMPDAKYSSDAIGEMYSGVKGYYTYLQEGLKEMQRQVGDLALDQRGVAYKGLLVRHLVLPGQLAGTDRLARFLSREVSPRCAVNVMEQYRPAYRSADYKAINRRVTADEYRQARKIIADAGLRLID